MIYQYRTLSSQPTIPNGFFSIRLLHLQPSVDPAAKIFCRLIETQIHDNNRGEPKDPLVSVVPYKALSYTWGSPVFPKKLHVVQEDDPENSLGAVIKITENLYCALQTLRKPDKELVLWVDAVCINQADIEERNSQVSNIPQTYTEATSVLVWLGTESHKNDGQLCLNFFTELAGLIANTNSQEKELGDRGSWRNRFIINQEVSKFLDENGHDVIISFLSRPWFRRRWIVQEVVLAKDVTIVCGTSKIHWPAFELAMTELFENDRGGLNDGHRSTLRVMSRIRDANSGAKSQVPLDTLVEFADFECANAEDRLYALYGVIQHWFLSSSSSTSTTGSVDYALSIAEIYTNFAVHMIGLSNSSVINSVVYNPVTHVLQLAAAMKKKSAPVNEEQSDDLFNKIPSWVPDWTGSLCYEPLLSSPIHDDVSVGVPVRQMEILTLGNLSRVLVATGLICDTVIATVPIDIGRLFGAVCEAKSGLNDFLCSVAKIFNDTKFPCGRDGNTYIPTGQHIISALATTIVANWEHTPDNSYFGQHPRFSIDFLDQLASARHQLPEVLHKWPAYVELITITMRGRVLMLTESGYLGIAAAGVQAGDLVCVLSKTHVPFVLRPSNRRTEIASGDGCRDSTLPGCYDFLDENNFKVHLSAIQNNSSYHCMFRLLGDAYVHDLVNRNTNGQLRTRPFGGLKILPIV